MTEHMQSVWKQTIQNKTRPPLEGDIRADALVVGGGMAGILIACALAGQGVDCVVAEAAEVGGGVTQNTTAKITAQHGLIYADLIDKLGIEKAKMYYEANTMAIDELRKLSERHACDFEEKAAWVYSIDQPKKLEREAQAYRKLGIAAHTEHNTPVPFKTAGALGLERQAQFHPLKLLYALADGLRVYEHTFVRKIEGDTAFTERGRIKAKNIILATHFPLINIPGLYFLKLYQHRSYVVALENAPLIGGMYVDERQDGHSFRTYKDLLFIGGGDHKTGKKGGGYDELHALAKRAFPDAAERYRWATQDCMTLDSVPYIGRHRGGTGNLYVAAGFNKWGMSGSMVASVLLRDLIVKGKSELAALYSPQRSMLGGQLAVNMGSAVAGLLRVGAPRCSHMGCKLCWNNAEKSWDCPCHGSRYDDSGRVNDGPAKKPILRT